MEANVNTNSVDPLDAIDRISQDDLHRRIDELDRQFEQMKKVYGERKKKYQRLLKTLFPSNKASTKRTSPLTPRSSDGPRAGSKTFAIWEALKQMGPSTPNAVAKKIGGDPDKVAGIISGNVDRWFRRKSPGIYEVIK